MLMFRRRKGQGVILEGPARIILHAMSIEDGRITLGIDADESVGVFRWELDPPGHRGPRRQKNTVILDGEDEDFRLTHPALVVYSNPFGYGKVELFIWSWTPLPHPYSRMPVRCCDKLGWLLEQRRVFRTPGGDWWHFPTEAVSSAGDDQHPQLVRFCPYCGSRLQSVAGDDQ